MQQPIQLDYHTLHTLAKRSGLHSFVVYRLMQGKPVKDPDAIRRLSQAWSELQQKNQQR